MNEIYVIKDTNLKKKKVIFLCIAIGIGLLLISPKEITWARDRFNYLIYANSSWVIMQRHYGNGLTSLLSNEPIFLLINIVLSFVFSPETTLKIIIFASALGVLYSLGKISKYNMWVLFFFLFLPQILKNHVIHLRQGLALSFYLIGITSEKRYGKIIKYASIFIHTSFAFILLFEFLEAYFKKIKFNSSLRILFSTICLTIFVFAIPYVATIFGDRRVLEYNFDKVQGASGLGFLIWLVAGTFFVIIAEKNQMNIIICYGIIFYLVSYFFLDFGARIFESIIPLLLVATLMDRRKKVRIIFILFFLLYAGLQWYIQGFGFLV